jgi:hypothetical protein
VTGEQVKHEDMLNKILSHYDVSTNTFLPSQTIFQPIKSANISLVMFINTSDTLGPTSNIH